jgi:hypothetical protein
MRKRGDDLLHITPLERAAAMNCTWREDSEGNWISQCSNAFIYHDGTPTENGMKFCCYCGKPITEIGFDDEASA